MQNNNLTIPQLLAKLDSMFAEEERLCNEMNELKRQYTQLQDDKEMLQNMIMYLSNKNSRRR